MHDVAHVKGRADVGADGERFRRAAAALAAPATTRMDSNFFSCERAGIVQQQCFLE
jgi:hypothetical protein